MSSALLFSAAALALVAVWAAGLVYMDLLTPEDVKAWRRLAALRGYAAPSSTMARVAGRAPMLQRLQSELDLSRLLAIAGRSETPLGFLARTATIGLILTAVLFILDVIDRLFVGDWALGVPPVIFIFIFVMTELTIFSNLRRSVLRRQANANKALGDMMMLVAIVTDARGLQVEDAVRILSRCVIDPSLQQIVDHKGFLRLVKQRYGSTIELYRMLAAAYEIPMFSMVADSAANANVGFSERETYTRLAKAVYQQRLAEAKMKGARAKILVTVPVAGMLIPLLVLIGAPTFASLANSLR